MSKNILYLIITLFLVVTPIALSTIDFAQAKSKSSGNEAMREIRTGLDLKGRTKSEVKELLGPPWQIDMTPVKARHNEKWTYSCEDKKGLTYDCVFIYFLADRVKNVEIF